MSTIKVVSMTGAEVGSVELNDAIFGIEPNMSVVHEVVKNHLANCRQGTQSALTRAEVSGGGRKPWRQKGTGRARQGSTRAPQWTHGGIVFAPKPRSYSYVLNKKVKRLALKSVLSAKAAQGEIVVVDKIALDAIKTKDFRSSDQGLQRGRLPVSLSPPRPQSLSPPSRLSHRGGVQNSTRRPSVITPALKSQGSPGRDRRCRQDHANKTKRPQQGRCHPSQRGHHRGVTTAPAKLINVYDLLNAKTLVIDKEALAVIEEVFA